MEKIFLELLNMSIVASWIVLAIVVFRVLFKKAPKYINVMLWGMVGIRLICPFSIERSLSLVPSVETVPKDIIYEQTPAIDSGVPIINTVINPMISDTLTPNAGNDVNPIQIVLFVASYIWLIGVTVMVLYTAISYLRIKRKVREAVPVQEKVWMCDHIDTPFILGVVRPIIYLPSSMYEEDVQYVLAHEQAHMKRLDHWWKPLGFALLTIYWFNPFLWVAYVLLCRDIELACDEKVIKEMGIEVKKPYSEALINCNVSRRTIAACPLAFGEVGVKERIRNILNYKKPAFWIIIFAFVISVIVGICFLTNPKEDEKENNGSSDNITVTVKSSPYAGLHLSPETLSQEDVNIIISILNSVEWENTDNRSLNTIVFDVGGKIYSYCSIEGLLIDHLENQCVNLTGETKQTVDDIIDKCLYSNLPPENVTMWFEGYNNWEDSCMIKLPELPEVTFECKNGNIIISDDGGVVKTIGSMAETCENGYFCDLTGDGIAELCLTMNVGSGIVDSRVVVYDYMRDILYELEERGNYDYSLLEEYDSLIITKKRYATENTIAEGRLSIRENGENAEMELLFLVEKIPNANKSLTPGTYLAGVKEYTSSTSNASVGTAYFRVERTGEVSVGQSFFVPSVKEFSYAYNGEQLILTNIRPTGESVETTIFVFDVNEYGSFVYNEKASTVPMYNHFFKDGMVFGLMPEDDESRYN